MNQEIILPLLVPIITAILSIVFRKREKIRDYISFTGSLFYLVSVLLLSSKVFSSGAVSYQAGGWPAPFGITLVADHLSVLMLLLTASVSLAVNLYSWGYIDGQGKKSGYYSFLHFMLAGMSGAFVTGDLFNLFVMFEVVLMSSYAMVAYSGTGRSLFTSLKYVVLNLIGSSLMLIAIGGLYSVTGTLNMADMAVVLSEGNINMIPVLGLSMILFCVFATKSGLVPFHFWAPPVYSNSPPPASALMAGISKKVGIYAVVRIYITVLSGAKIPETALILAGEPLNLVTGYLVGFTAVATVLLGGISAVNRQNFDELLAYSSVGQIGFIYMPVSLAMISGNQTFLIAALVYLVAHGLAKPALFMISGMIERMTGTSGLEDLGGLSESAFTLSAALFVSLFSLVGIPPLLGFFAKMLAFSVPVTSGNFFLLGIMLIGALFTLVYSSKAWLEIFFGQPVEYDKSRISRKEALSVIILAVMILVLGVNFEPVYQFTEQAAYSAANTEKYVETVLGGIK